MHIYRSGDRVEEVEPGVPHGDAWHRMCYPHLPPTHDVERHLALLKEKQKKGKHT